MVIFTTTLHTEDIDVLAARRNVRNRENMCVYTVYTRTHVDMYSVCIFNTGHNMPGLHQQHPLYVH